MPQYVAGKPLRLAGGVYTIIILIVVVGGIMAFAHSRGIEPKLFGIWVLIGTSGCLAFLSLLRWVLRAVGILPKTRPAFQGSTASASAIHLSLPEWKAEDTKARVASEIEQGKLWRGKEILRGQIGTYPYCPELYRAYGEVLFLAGDHLEAGKYLFLGGREDPESRVAIEIFLRRYPHPDHLWAQFPAKAKLHELGGFPESVAEELKRRGVRPIPSRVVSEKASSEPTWGWLNAAWGILVTLVFFLAVLVGLVRIVDLMFQALS